MRMWICCEMAEGVSWSASFKEAMMTAVFVNLWRSNEAHKAKLIDEKALNQVIFPNLVVYGKNQ